MMMESADLSDLDHTSAINLLNFAMLGAVHLEREMRARPVIVVEIGAHNSPEMSLIHHDDVVQALSANRSDQPLDARVLPWAPRCSAE